MTTVRLTYKSKSTGKYILISEMDTSYLLNALRKEQKEEHPDHELIDAFNKEISRRNVTDIGLPQVDLSGF